MVAQEISKVPPQKRAELSEVALFKLRSTFKSPKTKRRETTNAEKSKFQKAIKNRRRTHTKTKCKTLNVMPIFVLLSFQTRMGI